MKATLPRGIIIEGSPEELSAFFTTADGVPTSAVFKKLTDTADEEST